MIGYYVSRDEAFDASHDALVVLLHQVQVVGLAPEGKAKAFLGQLETDHLFVGWIENCLGLGLLQTVFQQIQSSSKRRSLRGLFCSGPFHCSTRTCWLGSVVCLFSASSCQYWSEFVSQMHSMIRVVRWSSLMQTCVKEVTESSALKTDPEPEPTWPGQADLRQRTSTRMVAKTL